MRPNRWINGFIGLLVLAATGVAYLGFVGGISISTLVFLEACTLALGVIVLSFWKKMTHPPESIEQLLDRTEHPQRQ
jgi:hypothetical protein